MLSGTPVQMAQFHACLQMATAGLYAIGFTAIYMNKEAHGKQHFTSNHGKAGLAALALMAANALYSPLRTLVKGRPLWSDSLHRLGGRMAFAASTVAVCLGLVSGWGMKNLGSEQAYGSAVAAGLISAYALLITKV
eukprot:CAMPEP_0118854440 /NCGR_PEP_ID=MMETSP1163-20130328/2651_1 /TAXON_ID=124430 /ORGANISM="Phaeomonas parva, Strain CCMP2877" /LENGTH=135 /DNA_ID=CAMNT_0006787167 /DNA_START=105 /DNA_END=512 /DNA_ORIENTATION=+